ncbi:MAG: flagellar assembly protein FliX [Acidiphilium sp.]|nr:flagellar assembly protein FliX [Acidiphilium sp.]MDD4935471.1 flagellar assembly protein FliX [Acidiphilium sp.]
MTRISGLGLIPLARSGGAAVSGRSSGFVVPRAAPSTTGTIMPVALSGLLALQEDDCSHLKDRAARRGGERVLDALGKIQVARLDGCDHEALAALNEAIGSMTEPSDPVLVGILGAIRLRARVELARRDRM